MRRLTPSAFSYEVRPSPDLRNMLIETVPPDGSRVALHLDPGHCHEGPKRSVALL